MNEHHKILVLEKDDSIREFVVFALLEEGCEPLPVTNGAQALILIAQQRPQLLLLDLYLPDVDGGLFVRACRQVADYWLPIILLDTSPQIEAVAKQIGVDDCLMKPFNLDDLLALLQYYLCIDQTRKQ